MIQLLYKKPEDCDIPMHEMKPLEIGIITSAGGYNNTCVMRTASTCKFEVMNLSDPGEDCCWTSTVDCKPSLKVKLLPSGHKLQLIIK